MMDVVITYCALYTILIIFGRIGISRHFRRRRKQQVKEDSGIPLTMISVIIPFRNEEKRIIPLLTSILESDELPARFIFVDDHSTDNTIQQIRSQLSNYPITLLTSKGAGKKAALQTGIAHAETAYLLTLDADVAFHPDYFTAVKKLSPADMHILPVQMSSRGWKQLFELDVYMVNSINLAVDGYSRPIAASGANLLFSKSAFEEVGSYLSHAHISSGDDQFLLADFNHAKKNISLHTEAILSVQTPVPESFRELINQRVRWIQKTPAVRDSLALKIGAIQVVMTLLFLILAVWSIYQYNVLLSILLLGTKIKTDHFFVSPYFSSIKKQGLLYWLPVYELLFPFYMLLLAILSLFFQLHWKGRPVDS